MNEASSCVLSTRFWSSGHGMNRWVFFDKESIWHEYKGPLFVFGFFRF